MKRKNIHVILVTILILAVLFAEGCGCGKKKAESSDAYAPVKGQSAEAVAKAAESMSYKSGAAETETLFADTEIPFDSFEVFIQKHTKDEFVQYDMDDTFFAPDGDDYLLGEFEKGRTLLYSFDYTGDSIAMKGRKVYKSKDELLSKNRDKNLTEDEYNGYGYTYHDNVLYYSMSDEDLFGIESAVNKYDLLKMASAGKWDKYTYWFSMPYKSDTEYTYYLNEEPDVIITDTESDGLRVEGFSGITGQQIYNLLTSVMKGKSVSFEEYKKNFKESVPEHYIEEFYNIDYRDPSEFENYETIRVVDDEDSAYVVLFLYTVKDGYPNVKPDSYMLGALVAYDYEERTFKLTNPDNFRLYEDDYYSGILTSGCYDAYINGMPFKRFWVPFSLYGNPVGFKDELTVKVLDAYMYADGDMSVDLYFYNDTPNDVQITTVDRLAFECDRGLLTDGGFDIYCTVGSKEAMIYTMYIPSEYVNYDWFYELSIVDFSYSVDILN